MSLKSKDTISGSVSGSSGSCTGNAATATALTSNAGSATQPVYFTGGKPTACTYTLSKSVPSDAKFTDTVYTLPNATSSVLGGVKVGSNITVSSGTISLTKANVTSALGYTPPTSDTNTTYSAGTGLSLSSTTFSVKYGTAAGTACQGNDSRLSNARPASDVSSWAKASSKPTYTYSEVGAAAASHSHNRIDNTDTRNNNTSPSEVPLGLSVHLKSIGVAGLSDGTGYYSCIMAKGWSDKSGGPWGQLTVTSNNNLWFRSSTSGSDTSWNAWRKASIDGHTHSDLANRITALENELSGVSAAVTSLEGVVG